MTELDRACFRLRAMIVEGCRIMWDVPHALERLALRDVTQFEAERVIRHASEVKKIEHEPNGSIRWRIAGMDTDGRPVDVVVKPHSNGSWLRVITVIRTDVPKDEEA